MASPCRTRGRGPRRGFGFVPSPLGGEGQGEGEGWVTALPGECRPTCEWHGFAMQDTRTPSSMGFRRRCAAGRVTFLCVAKEKSPKERPPPLVRPPASGPLGSPVCPTARADVPSMAQRRSLGVLPRGLDKRSHLGEQQGATPNPQHRGQLIDHDLVFTGSGSGGLFSQSQPLAHPMARPDCRTYAINIIDIVA